MVFVHEGHLFLRMFQSTVWYLREGRMTRHFESYLALKKRLKAGPLEPFFCNHKTYMYNLFFFFLVERHEMMDFYTILVSVWHFAEARY